MADTLVTIQEAAELSGKSIQTIRRALKANKIANKRKRTPQGFHYLINQESLIQFYKLRLDGDRKAGGIKKTGTAVSESYATLKDLTKLQTEIQDLLSEHEKAKESFMRFMKAFQERFVVLENQLKLIEAPGKKRWYQIWK
ncbi:MAG TPA: hypothetical protein VI588_01350 [Candidatus Gracilibacteria bacterium]|nr:hypothetical protein [Candidatus Gracilibacteria bacterium]